LAEIKAIEALCSAFINEGRNSRLHCDDKIQSITNYLFLAADLAAIPIDYRLQLSVADYRRCARTATVLPCCNAHHDLRIA